MDSTIDNLTKNDFLRSDWAAIVAQCEEKDNSAFSTAFSLKVNEGDNASDEKLRQIYKLLRDITSMYLKLDTPQEPFGPMMVFHDRRTTIVDDFDDTQLEFLKEIVDDVSDPELQARIADILWLRTRDFRKAQLAVTAYLQSSERLEDPERWVGAAERIERASQLAIALGKNASSFSTVVNHINSILSKYNGKDHSFFSAKLMGILLDYRVGDPAQNILRSKEIALQAEATQDWRRAREYWLIKARWHQMAREAEQERSAKLLAAETYVKEADEPLRREPPSYIHAAVSLQFAIEAFRKIANTQERVRELHATMLEYQSRSVSELVPISSSVDISDLVSIAEEHVRGKSLFDALLSLAMLGSSPKVAKLKSQAQSNNEKYIFQSLFPRVFLNAMGRVIARQPENTEESLRADMFSNASMSRGIHVQAFVEPARKQINTEHYIRVSDFMPLLLNSPLVPPGREWIIARGLYAGILADFLTAVHFLIPQIEASLRYLLSQSQVITSGFDDEGIQDEYNINRLLSASEFVEPLAQLFGEDLIFDLRGLLVERFGANLRNDMAHGLIDNDSFYSASGCYLWWISLRFYSLPSIAIIQGKEAENMEENE